MFAPLVRFLHRTPDPADADRAFVAEVRVRQPREPRNRRSEVILAIGWLLILAKCFAVNWACAAYAVPVNPGWIILPSLLFAVVCTWLYWRRD
jgi:hypothetical protein